MKEFQLVGALSDRTRIKISINTIACTWKGCNTIFRGIGLQSSHHSHIPNMNRSTQIVTDVNINKTEGILWVQCLNIRWYCVGICMHLFSPTAWMCCRRCQAPQSWSWSSTQLVSISELMTYCYNLCFLLFFLG